MDHAQIDQLRPSDKVYWRDPDGGACSRTYVIGCIHRRGNLVTLSDVDGSTVECFTSELSDAEE